MFSIFSIYMTTKASIGFLIAILAITAVTFSPILHNGLINRDDPEYITDNPLTKELSPASVANIFTTPEYQGDYHPLTLLGFDLQYHFFQDEPHGYHAVSLVLHLLAATLVFALVI